MEVKIRSLSRLLGFSVVVLLALGSDELYASEAKIIQYEVSYISVPLLDMTLNWVEDDSSIHVTYDNRLKPFIGFFYPIHNIYREHFSKGSFEPLDWSKAVSESGLHFELNALRSHDGNYAIFSDGRQSSFPPGGFTVFSATHYLARNARQPDFFPRKIKVFIDGEIWEAVATHYDSTHPHPDHSLDPDEVLIQTDLRYLSGQSLLKQNDILTSVIATEGTRFVLWVDKNGDYSRAQFGKFPKAVVLDRKN